jgi:hypothetical protein
VGRLFHLARLALSLLPESFAEPAYSVHVEVHHLRKRKLKAAAAMLTVEELEKALPEIVLPEQWEQTC